MIEWDKRTCHNPVQKNGCTFCDCDDCKYFYNDYEMDERGIDMIRAYDDNGNVIDMVEYEKQIRVDAFNECIVLLEKIMPPQPNLLKSKHYENWKMKTTELRMLRDMLEQLKGE